MRIHDGYAWEVLSTRLVVNYFQLSLLCLLCDLRVDTKLTILRANPTPTVTIDKLLARIMSTTGVRISVVIAHVVKGIYSSTTPDFTLEIDDNV